jgi:hypothetical protein
MSELTEFPSAGVCWDAHPLLLKYLKERTGNTTGYDIVTKDIIGRGLAWNATGLWTVSTLSNRPNYNLSELMPFISPLNIMEYSLTPEECYPVLSDFPKTGYCENPSTRVIDYLRGNHSLMRASGDKGIKWVTSIGQCWFSNNGEPNRGTIGVYTSEQLERILNLKQQKNGRQEKTSSVPCTGASALKVPRFNLTIRAGDPIRADTIRCPKGKIRFGGLNSSN